MPVSLELVTAPVVFAMRYGKKHKSYVTHDDYDAAGVLEYYPETGLGHVICTHGKLGVGFIGALRKVCREKGVTKLVWERMVNGKLEQVTLDI